MQELTQKLQFIGVAKLTDLTHYVPSGYNTMRGVYTSNYIFNGDWNDELASLDYTDRKQAPSDAEVAARDAELGIETGYTYNSFKSATGESDFHGQAGDFWAEERPDDFKYTDSYYNCPKLRQIVDWFQCEKARVRIFKQAPGHHVKLHTDFDNQRKDGDTGETVRIFVQLSAAPSGAWYRYRTGDSDVSVNLQPGQFLIYNQDFVEHQVQNVMDTAHYKFMIVAKVNDWVRNLANNETVKFIDIE